MKKHAKSYARQNAIYILYTKYIEKKSNIELSSSIDDQLALEISNYVLANEEEINTLIKPYLKKWSISELNPINLSILQIAIYELKLTDTPTKIIINEALEYAKKFSDDKSKKFIHFVLSNVIKEVRDE